MSALGERPQQAVSLVAAFVLSVLGANVVLAQEVLRRRLGQWDASIQKDMMTDSVTVRAATLYASDSSALLMLACYVERPPIVIWSTRLAQGDALSTVRFRFDSMAPTAPSREWEYSTTRRTPEYQRHLADLLNSPDSTRRMEGRLLSMGSASSSYVGRGAVAQAFVRRARRGSELRVEFGKGGTTESPLQSQFVTAGFDEVLQWLNCLQ